MQSDDGAFSRGSALGLVPALAFLGAGLAMAFWPTLASGFRAMQSDPGDTLFNAYLLEHHWQWLVGLAEPAGEGTRLGFWDPPIGHPLKGVLARGDVMLAFAPLYLPWRALGLDVETSFQAWMITTAVANYVAMWLLLRRSVGVDALAASVGAFLFAFAGARVVQLGHAQLLPQYLLVGALACVLVVFEGPGAERADPRRRRLAVWGFATCLVVQLWGGLYMGYFGLLVCGVALAVALASRRLRAPLIARLRARAGSLAIAAFVSAVALAPLVAGWLGARADGAKLGVGAAESRLPRLASYLYLGPDSWLYGGLAELGPFARLPEPHEQAIGLGLVTTGVTLLVAWRERRRPAVRVTAAVVAVLVVALTWLPFDLRLWRLWYYLVPGIDAIRAVARIGLLLAFPAAIAVAWLVAQRGSGGRGVLVVAVGLVCCLEQGIAVPSFDKRARQCEVEVLAARVDRDAPAFFLGATGSVDEQLLAMAAQQRTGIPTVNLYTGRAPRSWPLARFWVRPAASHEALEAELERTLRLHGVDPERVQRLERPMAPDCPESSR